MRTVGSTLKQALGCVSKVYAQRSSVQQNAMCQAMASHLTWHRCFSQLEFDSGHLGGHWAEVKVDSLVSNPSACIFTTSNGCQRGSGAQCWNVGTSAVAQYSMEHIQSLRSSLPCLERTGLQYGSISTTLRLIEPVSVTQPCGGGCEGGEAEPSANSHVGKSPALL